MTRSIWRNDNDGFEGVDIGAYTTLEGEPGLVLQQLVGGKLIKVVHVYRLKWLREIGHYHSPWKIDYMQVVT